jgi:hypothetical protein
LRNFLEWNVNCAIIVTETGVVLTCERNPPMAGPTTKAIAREDVSYSIMLEESIHYLYSDITMITLSLS